MKSVITLLMCSVILIAETTPYDTFSDEKRGFERVKESEEGYFQKEGSRAQDDMKMNSIDTSEKLEKSLPREYDIPHYENVE